MSEPVGRHRFEPARLLLGLSLIVIALAYLGRATERLSIPLSALLPALPAALVTSGLVAMVTQAIRRRRPVKRGGDG